MQNNRVYCLYRVSTDKQVDFNSEHEADIPMQRKACHRFAAEHGWTIIHEEQEEGISGHKVRAEHRDKLQIIKDHARQGKFDILLVFMFDRIGRIADETPFVVEWFVKNGIQVWSTQEGEQRFDNHTDKLLNYIRFWQADGESEKTSVRTRTSLHQMTEEGHFTGGLAPYGYDLVKSGRINKRKHELYELAVNADEATVVRMIFDKYVNEGYGAQRIATWLNEQGYRARSGKPWHHASIRGMLCNLTYTGVLRCGEARSSILPELRIIDAEQFDAAQEIRQARANHAEANRTVPLNTRGKSLLAGNVYCAHCGARLNLTTNGKYRKRADGSVDKTPRIRYICYGKTRKQTECDGPTGYTMHVLDGIIDQVVHRIFSQIRGVSKRELVSSQYQEEVRRRKAKLKEAKAAYDKAEQDLASLKAEIVKCIQGESSFSQDVLAELIDSTELTCRELSQTMADAAAELKDAEDILNEVTCQYDELISYADLYDSASIETKKMIVNCLISRVEVGRGYKLNIAFNFHLSQFFCGLDLDASA